MFWQLFPGTVVAFPCFEAGLEIWQGAGLDLRDVPCTILLKIHLIWPIHAFGKEISVYSCSVETLLILTDKTPKDATFVDHASSHH